MLNNALGWLIALAILPCTAAPVVSGDYEGLLIGVDRNSRLTGYYETSTGRGHFSCIFFIGGKLNDSIAHVDTWFPADRDPKRVIHGVIEGSSESDTPEIRLRLEQEHGGCGSFHRFVSDPSTLSLTEQGSWESIRVVASQKAYFYDDPSSSKPRKAFAVKGDALRVFETRGGWVRAEYVSSENQRTRGWISKSDLFSLKSPALKK